jgi:hypothetical protein
MDKNCPIYLGIGWVCENHPDRAWLEELGCMCGAGMPCQCNRVSQVEDVKLLNKEICDNADICGHGGPTRVLVAQRDPVPFRERLKTF